MAEQVYRTITDQMPTLANIRKVMEEFDSKFPPYKRLVKVKASSETVTWIKAHVPQEADAMPACVLGVPVEESEMMPYKFFARIHGW